MKKIITVFMGVVLTVTLFACKSNTKITPTATATSTPTQTLGSGEISAWYKKIKTNVYGPLAVVETGGSYFYCATDGVYEYDKDSKESRQIISDGADGLLLHKNDLYINLNDKIKMFDLDTREVKLVWEKSMLEGADEYFRIHDFEIHDGYLYIRSLANYEFRVNLENNQSEVFLNDVSHRVFDGENCLFTEHASKTFSIFSMNSETKEKTYLRGNHDEEMIDELLKVGDDILYSVRFTGKIYKLNLIDGNDSVAITMDVPSGNDTDLLDFIYSCQTDDLYYRISEGDGIKIYKYIGAEESVLVAEFNNRPKILAITESAIFYESDCEVGIKELT